MDINLTCYKCEQAFPIEEFNLCANKKNRGICKTCRKKFIQERSKLSKRRLKKENPEKYKKRAVLYREQNPEKFKASKKAWKDKNKERNREYNRAYGKRKDGYFHSPARKLTTRVRSCLLRLKGYSSGKKINKKSSFSYVGCESVEQFLNILSAKTENPNWLQDKYEIDHIWQVHWFREYIETNFSNNDKMDEVLRLINHHSNLRPLPADDNSKRSWYDFSPLKWEDFNKFGPFLNIEIRELIQKHFQINS